MSSALKKIERLAFETSVEDEEVIKEILDDLMKVRLSELSGTKSYNVVLGELSGGFDIPKSEVSNLTLKETIMLIAGELEYPYFEIDQDDLQTDWGVIDEAYGNAFSCFHLIGALLGANTKVSEVNRFLRIDLEAFFRFMAQNVNDPVPFRFCPEINIIVRKHCKATLKEKPKTLKDYLEPIFMVGCGPWACGVFPLGMYAQRIADLYKVTQYVILDCISDRFIREDEYAFEKIVDRLTQNKEKCI